MRTIIIEDDKLFVLVLQELVNKNQHLDLVEVFFNAEDAIEFLKQEEVDLILLDVELPEMSGMEVFPALSKSTQVILITGDKEYALEAFDYNVTDYILKPVTTERFAKAIQKAHEIFISRNIPLINKNQIFIRENNTYLNIEANHLLYIEALGDYVTITTKNKKFTLLTTMKHIESKLQKDRFIRTHRSFIVNINCIDSIDNNSIVIDKKTIPIGKSYKNNVFSMLNLI